MAEAKEKDVSGIGDYANAYHTIFRIRYSEARIEAEAYKYKAWALLGVCLVCLLLFLGFTAILALIKIEHNTSALTRLRQPAPGHSGQKRSQVAQAKKRDLPVASDGR